MPAKKKAAKKVAKKKVTKKKVTKKAPAAKKAKKAPKPSSPLAIMQAALKEGPPAEYRSVFGVVGGDDAIINGAWLPDWDSITCGEIFQTVEAAQDAARNMERGTAIVRFAFSGYPAMNAPEPEQSYMSEPEFWEAAW